MVKNCYELARSRQGTPPYVYSTTYRQGQIEFRQKRGGPVDSPTDAPPTCSPESANMGRALAPSMPAPKDSLALRVHILPRQQIAGRVSF